MRSGDAVAAGRVAAQRGEQRRFGAELPGDRQRPGPGQQGDAGDGPVEVGARRGFGFPVAALHGVDRKVAGVGGLVQRPDQAAVEVEGDGVPGEHAPGLLRGGGRLREGAVQVDRCAVAWPAEHQGVGDSPAVADELADLVVHGPKRATAGLLLEFHHDGEPLPREGGYSVVVGGRGLPVCVIRTTQVEVKPLREVDAAFAWDEGEGDRTLAWWLDAHQRFFTRRCAELGVAFSDELPTVFERFELVWPQPEETAAGA